MKLHSIFLLIFVSLVQTVPVFAQYIYTKSTPLLVNTGDTVFFKPFIFYILFSIGIIILLLKYLKVKKINNDLQNSIKLNDEEVDTIRTNLQQKIKFIDTILKITEDGIAVFDQAGNFSQINSALLKKIGYSLEEVKLIYIKTLVPQEYHDDLNDIIEGASKGEIVTKELEIKHKNEMLIDIRMTTANITNEIFIAVITDIFEKKMAEYEERRYYEKMQKLVKERTENYKKAKEDAENSNQLKTAFLANMSHEIRTPLNYILGFAQLLNEEDVEKEQIKIYTDLIQKGGQSLLHLVNDIIDLSKIEANQLILNEEDFFVNEMMNDIYNIYISDKDKTGAVEFKINIPKQNVGLYSDKNRIKQVLNNFLSNANKFTKEGYIELGYKHIMEERQVFLKFYVKDTGVGISKENLPRVFLRFTKFDKNNTRFINGAGLGLAISKRIVELLGGDIGVNTKLGEGSTFWFTIPLK